MGEPRCPACGYTANDAAIHMDHHLCPGEIPPFELQSHQLGRAGAAIEATAAKRLIGEKEAEIARLRTILTCVVCKKLASDEPGKMICLPCAEAEAQKDLT